MVKIRQPVPKSLNNLNVVKTISKNKGADKPKKSDAKIAALKKSAAIMAESAPKKITKKINTAPKEDKKTKTQNQPKTVKDQKQKADKIVLQQKNEEVIPAKNEQKTSKKQKVAQEKKTKDLSLAAKGKAKTKTNDSGKKPASFDKLQSKANDVASKANKNSLKKQNPKKNENKLKSAEPTLKSTTKEVNVKATHSNKIVSVGPELDSKAKQVSQKVNKPIKKQTAKAKLQNKAESKIKTPVEEPTNTKLAPLKTKKTKKSKLGHVEVVPEAEPAPVTKSPKSDPDGKILVEPHKIVPVPFNKEDFDEIVCEKNIKKISKVLKSKVEEILKEKKTTIFSDYRYFLNVESFLIPNCPRRMVKLHLKHSLVIRDEDDVAIIVPDLKRGAKIDYEPTIQHYEDLFREADINNLKYKIIPFNQLRNEMKIFEAKRKFCNTYDYLLCDGRIIGHAHGFLGKATQKPRTVLHSVRLQAKDLKEEIERALKRTAYRQQLKGDIISIPIGNHQFKQSQIADNVLHVVEQLKELYPGGLANIRSMNLKINIRGTPSFPIYISLCGPPSEVPYIVGPREKRMLKLKHEANTVLSKFALTKDAKLVKLNDVQIEHKRKIKEAQDKLAAAEKELQDNDGEEYAVPAKKSRKEDANEAKESNLKKDVATEENEDDGSDEEVEPEGENEDAEENDDNDDDENENEEDDDEEDGEEDSDSEKNDDDDDDDDDDSDGDDNEDDDDDDDDEYDEDD